MIPYILHVTIILTVCLGFYKVFLEKETFYRLNRWILLTCLAIAFVLPLLTIPAGLRLFSDLTPGKPLLFVDRPVIVDRPVVSMDHPVPSTGHPMPSMDHAISSTDHPAASEVRITPSFTDLRSNIPAADPATAAGPQTSLAAGILHWLYYGYIFGVVIAAISLLFQIAILLIQAYARPVVKDGRFRIIEMTGDHAPCSFGNNIFINPARYDWDTYCQILLHEKIHASGWHTLDLLLAEICIVIHWFNPFAWLYRKEVENNLEFLTDQAVLRDPGIERESYQLSLLKVSAPNMPLSITSNYNQSLLKRRIIMMNAKHSSIHTVWKYFFLLPLLIFLVCALNHSAAIAQTAASSKKSVKSSSAQHQEQKKDLQTGAGSQDTLPVVVTDIDTRMETVAATRTTLDPLPKTDVQVLPVIVDSTRPGSTFDRTQGSWFATTKNDQLCIEFKGKNDEEHNWSNNSCFPRTEFTGLNSTGKVAFKLVREAGAITFTGQFDGDQGFGHYTFQPNAEYVASLRKVGVTADENDMVTFFFLDMKVQYVAMLQANGYPKISKHQIISMAALRIDEAFIRSWKDLGYTDLSEERLISAKAMRLDKAYVEDLRKAGYDHLPIEKLISFKALGIDGDYVRRLNPGSPLPAEDLVTYKSLKIDSSYIASLKRAGYSDIPARDLVTLKSMNINGEFIQGFKNIGYTDIPTHDLVTLKSMHVTPEYIKSFRDIGYQDIPIRTLVSLRSLGITPEFAKGFKDIGYTDVPLEKLNSLKALGITAAFVKDFNSIGFKNIPLNQLHSLKALGVTADYVSKMRDKGFVSDDLEKYIRLKNASF